MHDRDDDRELAGRLAAGDEQAFEECFERYYPAVFRFALRRLHDTSAAEEVAQAALSQGLRRIVTYRGEAALLTWFCAVARREAASRRRRPADAALVALDAGGPAARAAQAELGRRAVEAAAEARARDRLAQRVHAALDRLPARYGEALEWKYLQGLSVQAIAVRLALGPKAAESLLTRARRAFRQVFERGAAARGRSPWTE